MNENHGLPMWAVITIAVVIALAFAAIVETQFFDDTHITRFIMSFA